jgi:hypothetical protein
MTLGVYLVRRDDSVSMLCLDLDVNRPALVAAEGDGVAAARLRAEVADEGLRLLAALHALGLDPLFEASGFKGRHLWLFFDAPMAAARVVAVGRQLVTRLRPASPRLALELFPKQSQVRDGGVGNLVKLPLGLHLGSGRRAALLDDAGHPLADPFARVRGVRRVSLAALEAALAGVPPAAEDEAAVAPLPAPPNACRRSSRAWGAPARSRRGPASTPIRSCTPRTPQSRPLPTARSTPPARPMVGCSTGSGR